MIDSIINYGVYPERSSFTVCDVGELARVHNIVINVNNNNISLTRRKYWANMFFLH